jgi:NAD(P)-dependent dehydrogenase (short-subunit alcohol dehydrogenase family)
VSETPPSSAPPGPPRRVAVVTGASSGIGEATVRLLASRGWHCVLVARRETLLRAIADDVGGDVETCDVADREAVGAMAARVLARHPAVHLLVNNAGIPARGSFLTIDPDRVELVTSVNYLGGVWCTRALLPGLEAAVAAGEPADVVNVVSVAGAVAFAPAGAYAAAKHAQLAFARSAGAALRHRRIGSHAVLPGFLETEGFPQHAVLKSRILRRFMTDTGAVAEAILRSVERNRAEVVVPWFPYRLVMLAQAVAPVTTSRLAGRFTYHRGEQHV